MNPFQELLFQQQDTVYGDFQCKLTPGIPRDSFIGVRIPAARKLAKSLLNHSYRTEFLHTLPHRYYDENILHALLISELKDFSECLSELEIFLPYVDNWAVCDILSPKSFRKHKEQLVENIQTWTASPHEYTCRFGMEMLMAHFLDNDFLPSYLEIPASVHREEYYVNMMIAWFFATALAKQWDSAIPYLLENKLDRWTHNKTIQKARESYRITADQKAYLQSLKR